MNEIDAHYPPEACPFCTIAAAYPACPPKLSLPRLWTKHQEKEGEGPGGLEGLDLDNCIPEGKVEVGRTEPGSFVVLAGKGVVAFLDILPMVGGMYGIHDFQDWR